MGKIMQYYSPKWLAVVGLFVSFINGFAFPIYGLLFADILFVMMIPQSPSFKSDRDLYCGLFLLEAFMIGILAFLQKYIFSYTGENLTYTFRTNLFTGMIYKQIAWFDSKDKAPGILSNILSEDINSLNGLTTENIALLMEAALSLIVGIIIAMLYTWKMALITLGVVPLVAFGAIMMGRL